MKYHYYPGCSLEGTALEYDRSTRAVLAALGVELSEIEGWSCCGASAAEATSGLLALVLPARNLALAERQATPMDVLVPCSACYLNLKTVQEKTRHGSAAGGKDQHRAGRGAAAPVRAVAGSAPAGRAGRRPGSRQAIRPKVVRPLTGATGRPLLRLPVPAAVCGLRRP